MSEFFNENTLHKVRSGLSAAGLTEQQITDAINGMQNQGILFRERGKEIPSHERCRIYGCDEPHAPGIIWCEKHKEPFMHKEPVEQEYRLTDREVLELHGIDPINHEMGQ